MASQGYWLVPPGCSQAAESSSLFTRASSPPGMLGDLPVGHYSHGLKEVPAMSPMTVYIAVTLMGPRTAEGQAAGTLVRKLLGLG